MKPGERLGEGAAGDAIRLADANHPLANNTKFCSETVIPNINSGGRSRH